VDVLSCAAAGSETRTPTAKTLLTNAANVLRAIRLRAI
jgi:hypothetical protein